MTCVWSANKNAAKLNRSNQQTSMNEQQINDQQIFSALERFGAQFPWQQVEVWVKRQPDGTIRFTAYLNAESRLGLDSNSSCSEVLEDAIAAVVRESGGKSPEANRDRAVEQLEQQLKTLKAVTFDDPPYRPGTRLAAGALQPSVDVETRPAMSPEEHNAFPQGRY